MKKVLGIWLVLMLVLGGAMPIMVVASTTQVREVVIRAQVQYCIIRYRGERNIEGLRFGLYQNGVRVDTQYTTIERGISSVTFDWVGTLDNLYLHLLDTELVLAERTSSVQRVSDFFFSRPHNSYISPGFWFYRDAELPPITPITPTRLQPTPAPNAQGNTPIRVGHDEAGSESILVSNVTSVYEAQVRIEGFPTDVTIVYTTAPTTVTMARDTLAFNVWEDIFRGNGYPIERLHLPPNTDVLYYLGYFESPHGRGMDVECTTLPLTTGTRTAIPNREFYYTVATGSTTVLSEGTYFVSFSGSFGSRFVYIVVGDAQATQATQATQANRKKENLP